MPKGIYRHSRQKFFIAPDTPVTVPIAKDVPQIPVEAIAPAQGPTSSPTEGLAQQWRGSSAYHLCLK
jgi:hypothetical protein